MCAITLSTLVFGLLFPGAFFPRLSSNVPSTSFFNALCSVPLADITEHFLAHSHLRFVLSGHIKMAGHISGRDRILSNVPLRHFLLLNMTIDEGQLHTPARLPVQFMHPLSIFKTAFCIAF